MERRAVFLHGGAAHPGADGGAIQRSRLARMRFVGSHKRSAGPRAVLEPPALIPGAPKSETLEPGTISATSNQ